MKWHLIAALFLALTGTILAQEHPTAASGLFKNDRDAASYAFGMNLGLGLRAGRVDLSTSAVAQGLKDSLAGGPTLLTEAEMASVLAGFGHQKKDPAATHTGSLAEENRPAKALPQDFGNGRLENEGDRAGYAFGMEMGRGWQEGQVDLDPEMTVQGLKDALTGDATLLTRAEMDAALARFGRELRVVQQHHRERVAEENRRQGELFLARNKSRPGVVSLPSGLQYKVTAQGTGPHPALTNWVRLKYRAMRIDGSEFESSAAHPEAGIVGLGSVTQGWAEALQRMSPGAKWRLFVPPSLAYGKDGSPGVGPNETLVYDVELVSILPGQPQPTAEDIKNEREPDGD